MFFKDKLHQALGCPFFRIWVYVDRANPAADVDVAALRAVFPDLIRAEDLVTVVGSEGLNAKTH